MFCARCGQQIPEASEVCPLCGREAVLHLPPPASVPQNTATLGNPYLQPAPTFAVVAGPRGIGGWLSFFCVSITILGPLGYLGIFALLRRPGTLLSNPNVLIGICRVIYGMVVGIYLWTARPIAMLLLRIYFACFGIAVLLAIQFFVQAGIRGVSFMDRVEAQRPFFLAMVYLLIWIAYFLKSVRVRNTYGRNL